MGKRILIADDSRTIQKVVDLTFLGTEFEVVSADNGSDAVTKLGEVQPDVVLADVTMSGKNGYELCREIKASANIPVLLLDSAEHPCDEAKASEAQADGHLKKPFDSQTLINRVKVLTGMPVEESAVPMSYAEQLAAKARKEASPPPEPVMAADYATTRAGRSSRGDALLSAVAGGGTDRVACARLGACR